MEAVIALSCTMIGVEEKQNDAITCFVEGIDILLILDVFMLCSPATRV